MTKILNRPWLAFISLLLIVAAGGLWWLYHESELPAPVVLEELPRQPVSPGYELEDIETVEVEEALDVASPAPLVWPKGMIRGELVLSFRNRAALEQFLREARLAGLTDLEVIPELGLVRVRAKNDDEVRRAWRLGGNAEIALNPIVAAPEVPPLEEFGDQYRPFGDQALGWMGVPDDNSTWGEGARIAILDTGVGDHPSLAKASIIRMSMLGEGAEVGTHGTAVASLIVGQGEVRGIAPAAEILSIQVLDADGSGSAFDLARGIIAAVDAGANPINLSLGTPADSAFLREAVLYAQEHGRIILAATGNNGGGRSLFPAAYEGVVSIGSVDSNGQHVGFSNRDYDLSFVAPGYGLLVAGPDGTVVYMNGTSFSAPLVSGAVGSLLSKNSTQDPVSTLMNHVNDGGAPGHDGYYGHGIPDMERVSWENKPGFYDVAVAGHHVDYSRGYPEMVISVQNQGTEVLGGIALQVEVNGRLQTFPIGALNQGAVGAARIPLNEFAGSEQINVVSVVAAPGIMDRRSWNDGKQSSLLLKR